MVRITATEVVTVAKQKINFHGEKERGLAILASNCGGQSGRYHYLDSLMKNIPVTSCPIVTCSVINLLFLRLMSGAGVGRGTTCPSGVQVRMKTNATNVNLNFRSFYCRLSGHSKIQILSGI